MLVKRTLRAAAGWLELGLPDDALEELSALSREEQQSQRALDVKLAALMAKEEWNEATEIAQMLCKKSVDETSYFLSAAYCLHEIGDTENARRWLLKGPKSLYEIPVFHYNMACYLWVLGERERAKNHLAKAVEMDESFLEAAKTDKDFTGMEF